MNRSYGLAVALGLLMGLMSFLSPYFFTLENLLGFTRHLVEIGILACGMTLIIMSGGIDLSVGSLLGLSGIVLGYAWQFWGPVPAVLMAMLTGLAGGSLNGLLITRWRLPPLIVTLATMALFRGTAMVISKAQPVTGFPDAFAFIGQGDFFGIPVQLVIWLLVMALTLWLASRTRTGRAIAAIGDSPSAARFAAIAINRITFLLYTGMGALCALGALIFTARVSTARADAGLGLELDVITAVVLGGTPITGGPGSVLGTFLGVMIMGIVRNGLSLAGISSVWQTMLAGLILIGAAVINQRLSANR
jgi:rhamnose transport system permease protein